MGSTIEKQKKKKDGQLLIRINSDERDAFIELCDQLDSSAAREIRLFIRDFLKKHAEIEADTLSASS